MKTLGIIGSIILVLVAAAVWDAWPTRVRYRLTLNVEDGNTKIVGSSVIEGVYNKEPQWFPNPSSAEWHYDAHGEAVVVDLGKRGVLFVLLKAGSDPRSDAAEIALRAFGYMDGPNAFPINKKLRWIASLGRRIGAKADISPNNLPMLVRFHDINDPKTVERVDPNNLAATFGEGVNLVSTTIEITDEPITTGIEKVLPSWKGTDFAKWRASLPYGHPLAIDRSDFIKGASK